MIQLAEVEISMVNQHAISISSHLVGRSVESKAPKAMEENNVSTPNLCSEVHDEGRSKRTLQPRRLDAIAGNGKQPSKLQESEHPTS